MATAEGNVAPSRTTDLDDVLARLKVTSSTLHDSWDQPQWWEMDRKDWDLAPKPTSRQHRFPMQHYDGTRGSGVNINDGNGNGNYSGGFSNRSGTLEEPNIETISARDKRLEAAGYMPLSRHVYGKDGGDGRGFGEASPSDNGNHNNELDNHSLGQEHGHPAFRYDPTSGPSMGDWDPFEQTTTSMGHRTSSVSSYDDLHSQPRSHSRKSGSHSATRVNKSAAARERQRARVEKVLDSSNKNNKKTSRGKNAASNVEGLQLGPGMWDPDRPNGTGAGTGVGHSERPPPDELEGMGPGAGAVDMQKFVFRKGTGGRGTDEISEGGGGVRGGDGKSSVFGFGMCCRGR